MTHSLSYDGGDGLMHEMRLSRGCPCTRMGLNTIAPRLSCERCHGRGEYLTSAGKSLLEFVAKWSEVRA